MTGASSGGSLGRVRLTGLLLVVAVSVAPPASDAPLPRDTAPLAIALAQTHADLRTAIGRWTPKSADPPREVVLYALYEQRIYRLLTRNAKVAGAVLTLLPSELRVASRDLLAAQRELYRLTPPLPSPTIKVGRAPPAPTLLGYYRAAERRFGVPWNVLAAVNFVETKFGKIRNTSAAGAQGPMQFIPLTWRRYGLGGDVNDPHDAILGAANYLQAIRCTAQSAARASRLQPFAGIRRRGPEVRTADARGARDVLRALQLAGLRQDASGRSARHGPGSALTQMLSSPTLSKPRRRYSASPCSLGARIAGSPVSVSIAARVRAVP